MSRSAHHAAAASSRQALVPSGLSRTRTSLEGRRSPEDVDARRDPSLYGSRTYVRIAWSAWSQALRTRLSSPLPELSMLGIHITHYAVIAFVGLRPPLSPTPEGAR